MRAFVNPIVRVFLRTPLARRAPALALLQFQGRRTQRNFMIPVMVHDCDGVSIVCTDAGWSANFAGGAPVLVRRSGHATETTATVVSDQERAADLIRRVLAEKGPRALGLAVDQGHEPTSSELNSLRTVIRLGGE
jgi:hypothetical protein